MDGKKCIFYKYQLDNDNTVSDERFEIPKSAQYMLLYDCEDTVLKFIYELVDKFASCETCLIGDEQRNAVKEIKQIIQELQENDGYRLDFEQGKQKVKNLYGRLGELLQVLWI